MVKAMASLNIPIFHTFKVIKVLFMVDAMLLAEIRMLKFTSSDAFHVTRGTASANRVRGKLQSRNGEVGWGGGGTGYSQTSSFTAQL